MIDGRRHWFVTETVVSQERYDDGPFYFGASYEDGSLDRIIASLIAIRETIPAEYRDSARCEIDSESGYEGSHYASIEVSYSRPETAEETLERERHKMAETVAAEQKQRAAYEALKAKFG